MRRDSSGRAKVAAPSASDDIARRDTVDNAVNSHAAVKATSQTIGHVKPDGSSISVDASGTLSAAVKSVAGRTGAVTLSIQDILGLTAAVVELGSGSYAGDEGAVAIGRNAYAPSQYSTAVGDSSYAYHRAVALGKEARALARYAIAIGDGAYVDVDQSMYSMALGQYATVSGIGSIAIGRFAEAQGDHRGVLGIDNMLWSVPGSFSVSGSKNFEIPHPKPEKSATHVIRHGAVEAPSPGETLYRWRIRAEQDNDTVEISLPDYFVHLNTNVQVFVTPQGHFGNGYGELDRDRERLVIRCQLEGEYKVLAIGTRCDDHLSIRNWHLKGVERKVGETWEGETEVVYVNEIIEIEEIKEVSM